MSQATSRKPRVPLEEAEPLTESSSLNVTAKDGKRRTWQSQSFDRLASQMNQPHLVLNLFSIVFFTVGCIMLLFSSHQQGIKLIMPDCRSETTITQNTNKYVSGGDFYEDKGRKEHPTEPDDSKTFTLPLNKKPSKVSINLYPKTVKSPSITVTSNPGNVEFVVSGHTIPIFKAMQLHADYNKTEHVDYSAMELKEMEDVDMSEAPGLKFFIGVTSKCCTEKSRRSRDGIRQTWMKYALDTYDNVDIKFFLAQPDISDASVCAQMLEEEMQTHNDIVVVRGRDLYENLPNKTFGMLKYALSSPKTYTHILKTDDDCYVRVGKLMEILNPPEGPQLQGMYKGCMENRGGFWPIRDSNSKWYLRYDELDDYTAQPIKGTKYLAGWGYILTRDLAFHAMKKVYAWDNKLENVPAWYPVMKWEDVLMGILLADKVSYPDADFHFKAAWRACTNETAIRHLDLDAPGLFTGLYEQEHNGLWDKKTVQCSSGNYVAGDYGGWKRWRNSVTAADSRI